MSTAWSLTVSVALLVLNAFFVAAEFALVASRRHRLEAAAAGGSAAARAAVRGIRELSMMLAGAQLGITLCTLGLGALAKPTVAHLAEPALAAFGLPEKTAYPVAFVLAVSLVGFLHVVIGEMAPKSWAISHPEESALLLALPFRWFTTLTRPALVALNGLANLCLRVVRVPPQDELAQAHGPEELRMLVRASHEHGTLAEAEHELLSAILAIQETSVARVMIPADRIAAVRAEATARAVERASRRQGRSRLVVTDPAGTPAGIVHVRDAARATTTGNPATAADLMTEPLLIERTTGVAAAGRTMRDHRAQLALVTDPDGTVVGLVAMEDLLEEIIGNFDDETDPILTAARAVSRPAT